MMDENARLKALKDLEIVDTNSEESFDEIVKLAATICGTPISAISLVTDDRQWFKAKVGVPVSETPRDISFCTHAIADTKTFVVEDAAKDPRFANNPLVTSGLGVRFYAGAPLTNRQGLPYGTLCVIDTEPRHLSEQQLEALQNLSSQVVRLMEYRREIRRQQDRYVQAEEARRFLRKFFAQSPLMMGITEIADGKIHNLSSNLATEQFFGRTNAELSAAPFTKFDGDPTQFGVWFQAYTSARETRAPVSFCFQHENHHGLRTIEAVVYHIGEGPTGNPQFSYVAHDVTSRIEQDKTIAYQRGIIMENAKLSSIGEMASGIAHEINNPLTIIHATLGMLAEKIESNQIDSPAVVARLTKLRGTCERITKIIHAMRTISRDGEQDPLTCTDLRPLVEDTLELCRERFRNHSIDLRIHLEEVTLVCRPVQISQILLNLLNNAFDAVVSSPEPWVDLSVTTSANGRIRLAVTDSGWGISETVQTKMMNPFFTTKPVGKGTGLGLSIARGLAESNGGTLTYDPSAPHTRFVLELPIARAVKKAA